MTIAYILAGGYGKRLKKVVPNLPKPMAIIEKKPFLEYLLDYWIDEGVTKFIISVGYLKDIIIKHFGNKYKNIPIEYFVEKSPLGTGGGLIFISNQLSDPFIVLNGDTFFEVSLKELLMFKKKNKIGFVMNLFETSERDRYGIVDIKKKIWVESIDQLKKNKKGWANGGVYLINPDVFKKSNFKSGVAYSLERDIIPYLISLGNIVGGNKQKKKFLDIGIPKDYYKAKKFFEL